VQAAVAVEPRLHGQGGPLQVAVGAGRSGEQGPGQEDDERRPPVPLQRKLPATITPTPPPGTGMGWIRIP
jgi:hypothetical protein